jgi:hypothetical protein
MPEPNDEGGYSSLSQAVLRIDRYRGGRPEPARISTDPRAGPATSGPLSLHNDASACRWSGAGSKFETLAPQVAQA